MKYKLKLSKTFKKDLKKCIKRGLDKDKLNEVVDVLLVGGKLEERYRDHKLVNCKKYMNMRECHIQPDWLLVYKQENDILVVTLVATGTHSDLF